MRRRTGFTLVEMIITLAVMAILLALAAPNFTDAISRSKARAVVSRFKQDFTANRSKAATTSSLGGNISMTLNSNCTWTTSSSVSGTDTVHSMAGSDLAGLVGGTSSAPNITCNSFSQTPPITFSFTSQGFVSPSASFTVVGSTGGTSTQSWPITIMGSGSVFINSGGVD